MAAHSMERGECSQKKGQVSKDQEVRRGRKSGQELTRVATDSRGKPQSHEGDALHLPVPG